jgi:hypothetical protein
MASSVGQYYDHLHMVNCRKELLEAVSEDHSHVKAIWLALNASYALEAFRFMVIICHQPGHGRESKSLLAMAISFS